MALNVLHITLGFGPGGRRVAIRNFLEYGRKPGFQYTICCLSGFQCETSFLDKIPSDRRVSLDWGGGFDVGLLRKLRVLIQERHVDLVHAHDGASHFYGVLATRLLKRKIPVVYTFHRSADIDTGGLRQLIRNRILNAFTAATITASLERRDYYAVRNRIDKGSIQTIYYGMDVERWQNPVNNNHGRTLRKKLGIKEQDCVIGVAANLIRRKGVDNVISAFADSRVCSRSVLVVVGEGPERDTLVSLATRLHVADRVHFVGHQSDMRAWYGMFDIYAMTPFEEAFGMVFAEAQLSGNAVIGSNVGGIPEIIRDHDTGLLVPAGDPSALSAALGELLESPAVRTRLAKAGMQYATAAFPMERMLRSHESVYQELLHDCSRSSG